MFERIVQKLNIIFIPSKENEYRPKFLESQTLFYCLVALLILKLFTIPFFLFFPKNIFFASIIESTLIKLVNQDRQSLSIQPLKENSKLKTAALLKAQDMLEKDYFSHMSPEGISPWHWLRIAGYDYKIAGENLAIGFLDSEQVHQAWLESPSHRANLLNPNYQEIGIAVMKGDFQGNKTTIVVQFFASPDISLREVKTKSLEGEAKLEKEKIEKEIEKEEIEKEETLATQPQTLGEKLIPSFKEAEEPRERLVFNFFSFLSSDYYWMLQVIIYGFLILIIIALIINIFVRFDIQHPDLIFKAFFFICLLILFAFIDKVDMIKLISPNFIID